MAMRHLADEYRAVQITGEQTALAHSRSAEKP